MPRCAGDRNGPPKKRAKRSHDPNASLVARLLSPPGPSDPPRAGHLSDDLSYDNTDESGFTGGSNSRSSSSSSYGSSGEGAVSSLRSRGPWVVGGEAAEVVVLDDTSRREGWSPMSGAVAELERHGVQVDQARAALEAVRGSREAPQTWVDEALCWICDQHDLDNECQEMRQVMAQSLMEHEERVRVQVPLEDKTHEELCNVFTNSKVLPILQTLTHCTILFSDPLKRPMVRFLALEQNCIERWYPGVGTCQFFERLGQECLLCAACPGAKQATAAAATASREACPLSHKKDKNGKETEAAKVAVCSGQEHPRGQGRELYPGQQTSDRVIGAIGKFLESKEQMVLEAVSRMPLMSGETPDIFKVKGPEEDSGSEIEITEVKPSVIENPQVAVAID